MSSLRGRKGKGNGKGGRGTGKGTVLTGAMRSLSAGGGAEAAPGTIRADKPVVDLAELLSRVTLVGGLPDAAGAVITPAQLARAHVLLDENRRTQDVESAFEEFQGHTGK